MSRVARRFDLSLGSLARINGVKRGHSPKVGETLIVYVEKGKTRGTKAPPEASEGTLTRELAQQAPAKIDGTQAETREALSLIHI